MESLLQRLINTLPEAVCPESVRQAVVVIDETDPVLFWNAFTGACATQSSIVLIDPSWPARWKKDYIQLAKKHLEHDSGKILIPTSGTTDKPKFCIHTTDSLESAARAFAERFQPSGLRHSVNVLPPHHVGGLMPVFRSAVLGGKCAFAGYRQLPETGLEFSLQDAGISLVPTQLKRILASEQETALLSKFGIVFIGGAACPQPLLNQSRKAGLNLAPCYGSTETAALVTALDPELFLQGMNSVGQPLPGISVSIAEDGRVLISSQSVQSGYLPGQENFCRDPYRTNDLGEIDSGGHLHILGRSDRVIITGGKKVIPEQIENICWQTGLVIDVWCHGIPDADWGSSVRLDFVPSQQTEETGSQLLQFLKEQLPAYAVPKDVIQVDIITRNQLGKKAH